METYKILMNAIKIIKKAQAETGKEDGYTGNPAWDKLYKVERYLMNQASAIL